MNERKIILIVYGLSALWAYLAPYHLLHFQLLKEWIVLSLSGLMLFPLLYGKFNKEELGHIVACEMIFVVAAVFASIFLQQIFPRVNSFLTTNHWLSFLAIAFFIGGFLLVLVSRLIPLFVLILLAKWKLHLGIFWRVSLTVILGGVWLYYNLYTNMQWILRVHKEASFAKIQPEWLAPILAYPFYIHHTMQGRYVGNKYYFRETMIVVKNSDDGPSLIAAKTSGLEAWSEFEPSEKVYEVIDGSFSNRRYEYLISDGTNKYLITEKDLEFTLRISEEEVRKSEAIITTNPMAYVTNRPWYKQLSQQDQYQTESYYKYDGEFVVWNVSSINVPIIDNHYPRIKVLAAGSKLSVVGMFQVDRSDCGHVVLTDGVNYFEESNLCENTVLRLKKLSESYNNDINSLIKLYASKQMFIRVCDSKLKEKVDSVINRAAINDFVTIKKTGIIFAGYGCVDYFYTDLSSYLTFLYQSKRDSLDVPNTPFSHYHEGSRCVEMYGQGSSRCSQNYPKYQKDMSEVEVKTLLSTVRTDSYSIKTILRPENFQKWSGLFQIYLMQGYRLSAITQAVCRDITDLEQLKECYLENGQCRELAPLFVEEDCYKNKLARFHNASAPETIKECKQHEGVVKWKCLSLVLKREADICSDQSYINENDNSADCFAAFDVGETVCSTISDQLKSIKSSCWIVLAKRSKNILWCEKIRDGHRQHCYNELIQMLPPAQYMKPQEQLRPSQQAVPYHFDPEATDGPRPYSPGYYNPQQKKQQ